MQPFPILIHATSLDHLAQISTIILALFTILLWAATAGLMSASRKATRLSLSSYISFKDLEISLNVDAGGVQYWDVKVLWQNTGPTFTQNMHNHIYVEVLDIAEDHPLAFPSIETLSDLELPRISVSPGSVMGGGRARLDISDILAAQAGHKKIVVRGWTQYADIFKPTKDSHRSEFCYLLFCDGNPLVYPCRFSYQFHSNHNRSDREIGKTFTRIKI